MSKTNTLLEYVKWRGDLPFSQSPFNDIDAMVLAQLSSINYGDLVPGAAHVNELTKGSYDQLPALSQVSEKYSTSHITQFFEEHEELLIEAGKSARFGSIRMDGFINDVSVKDVKQFSATTFMLDKRLAYIAFRGTDDTLVSWQENFCTSYTMPVPSQSDALAYLTTMSKGFRLKIMVGGHSKGGNLAVYASTFAHYKIQKKIKRIFAFDSPGFLKDLSEMDEFQLISDLITAYSPSGTVIGTLLNVPYKSVIIQSLAKGVNQHFMFTWAIQGSGLIMVDQRDEYSYLFEKTLKEKLEAIPEADKPQYIDDLFAIFKDNEIYRLNDFVDINLKQSLIIIKRATSIPAPIRSALLSLGKVLWDAQHGN